MMTPENHQASLFIAPEQIEYINPFAKRLALLNQSLEDLREYYAGPCTAECVELGLVDQDNPQYNGHQHNTEYYEDNRAIIIDLNHVIEGHYDWTSSLKAISQKRLESPIDTYEAPALFLIVEDDSA